MTTRKILIRLVHLVLAFGLLALVPATAQARDFLTSKIPFAFTVGSTELPAGDYKMTVDWAHQVVIIEDMTSGKRVPAPLITSLAKASHTGSTEGRLVFDKTMEGRPALSEVWLPNLDGALVGVTKGAHEHKTVHTNG